MATKDSAKKHAKTSNSVEQIGERRRHSLTLRAWEVINSEREIQGVIEAVADVLIPVVPFAGIAIIAPEARQGAPWALHVVGESMRDCESVDDFEHRIVAAAERERAPATDSTRRTIPEKRLMPYGKSELDEVERADLPYICNDLMAKEAWFPHEFKLAAAREIENADYRAQALMAVANFWLEQSQVDEARNLLGAAQGAISKVFDDEERSELMRRLAVILARLHSYRAARETAEQCSGSSDRLAAYTAILREYHIERDPSLAQLFAGEEEVED